VFFARNAGRRLGLQTMTASKPATFSQKILLITDKNLLLFVGLGR
jgi:hypothetical protein